MLAIDVNNKIRMVRGDTACIEFALDNHTLVEGDKVKFTVKQSYAQEEPSIIKEITTFTENGTALIVLKEEDTKGLEAGDYLYELEVRLADGTIDTIITAVQFKLIADLG